MTNMIECCSAANTDLINAVTLAVFEVSLVTLYVPMKFAIKFDTVMSDWSIVYIVDTGYNFKKKILRRLILQTQQTAALCSIFIWVLIRSTVVQW